MKIVLTRLMLEEAGYVASAELVLIATVAVLGLVVGLSEVAFSINHELADVANAFAAVNQGFQTGGFNGRGGFANGSGFNNDFCAGGFGITSTSGTGEQ